MKKYPILLIAWLAPGAAGAGLKETLQKALGDYCVPKEAQYCEPPFLAAYNSNASGANKCGCPCDDMKYVEAERRCVDCEYGSTGRFATECKAPSCPTGMFWQEAAGCPAGYAFKNDVAACPAGTYMVATAGRACLGGVSAGDNAGCPAGFYRYNY